MEIGLLAGAAFVPISMSTTQLAELDRPSRAFAGSGQEQYLRSFTWAVDRVLGPDRRTEPAPDQHLDRVFLELPWELDGQSEVSTKTRVTDRRGKLVGLFVNEDVATLIVHLTNQTPADQATTL